MIRHFYGWIGHAGGRVGLLSGVVLLTLGAFQSAPANLMINVSYPNMANVPAAAVTEINNVVNLLDSSFINNATINVTVDFTTTCGLGCSTTFGITPPTYADWRTHMIADSTANPQNGFLAAAIPTLPAADPIGNGTLEFLRRADAKALGYAVGAGNDAALTFNCIPNPMMKMNCINNGTSIFEFTGVPTAGLYDFQNTFEHELDEALGIGSALTNIPNNGALPTSFEPEDYFRYSSTPGMRSITTNPNAAVYFSYDGVTDLDRFNQDNNAGGNPMADRNDWIWGNFGCPAATVEVQSAVGCQNQVAPYGFGSPEFAVLETLGYDPIPEPGTLVLLATSLLGLGALRWRVRET